MWFTFLLSFFPQLAQFYFSRYTLNLIFEFLFHISIKIIPKFFIVSLCTVVLFLTSVVSVFLHLSKNKSKIFKYSCKAIISLFLSLILLINVPFNYKTERLRFTHSDYEIVISRYYVMTVQRIQVLVTDNSVFAHEILYVGLPTGDFNRPCPTTHHPTQLTPNRVN